MTSAEPHKTQSEHLLTAQAEGFAPHPKILPRRLGTHLHGTTPSPSRVTHRSGGGGAISPMKSRRHASTATWPSVTEGEEREILMQVAVG